MPTFRQITPQLPKSNQRRARITGIIFHADDGKSIDGTVETLRTRGLAYHYLIGRDGIVWTAYGDQNTWLPVAAHAGNSYGPTEEFRGVSKAQDAAGNFIAKCSVNSYTIGIAFQCYDTGGQELTGDQIRAAIELVAILKTKVPTLAWISTHAIVSPGRKTDPKAFDVDEFSAKVGLPVWRPSKGSKS
jgi:N-acetyl-anhydromuramyl-L-alanine amidase AmpD